MKIIITNNSEKQSHYVEVLNSLNINKKNFGIHKDIDLKVFYSDKELKYEDVLVQFLVEQYICPYSIKSKDLKQLRFVEQKMNGRKEILGLGRVDFIKHPLVLYFNLSRFLKINLKPKQTIEIELVKA